MGLMLAALRLKVLNNFSSPSANQHNSHQVETDSNGPKRCVGLTHLRQLRQHLRDPEKYARAGQNQRGSPNELYVTFGLVLSLHHYDPACASLKT